MLIANLTFILVGIASVFDYRTRRIPNLLTLPVMAIGLILNVYYSGLVGLQQSILGLLLGVGLLLIPFAIGGMGAGDVKLLAAVGALNGPQFVLFTCIYGAIAGGVMAVVLLLLKGRAQAVFANVVSTLVIPGQHLANTNLGIPYGIAIGIGALITWYLGVM